MRQKRVRRQILTGVTGEARSGEVTAIMGASGGGKTTLLNILAQRISSGRRKGTVELDAGEGAVAVSGGMMRRVSAYVMQDDILYTSLTVRETLMYAAELRLGPQLSWRAKEDKVARLIDLLGLAKVAETLIGGERKRGVSGGERKRVAIGVEMVSDPKILYLDEPTSGLDSTNAFRVVRAIKSVAVQTESISVMVIHQPSYRVLCLIDKLLLLGVGQTAYLGPPAGLPDFLSSLGSPVPEGSNSTEHGLDVMAVLQAQGVADIQAYVQACKAGAANPVLAARKALEVKSDAVTPKSSMGKLVWRQPSKGQPDDEPQKTVRKEKDRPEFANGWFWELWLLTKRATVNVMRTPAQYLLRLVLILVTGLLLAILFWRPKETVPTVTVRHYFSRLFTSHGRLLLVALLLTAVSWWSISLAGGTEGFLFMVVAYFVMFFVAKGMATCISVCVKDIVLGYALAISIMSYCFLVSGFYVTRTQIPSVLIWLHYLSPFKYAYEALAINQFARLEPWYLNVKDITAYLPSTIPSLPDSGRLPRIVTAHSFNTTQLLMWRSVDQLGKWECLAVLLVFGLAVYLLTYVMLVRLQRSKHK
ncbi:hypothetical protein CLOP_g2352 [Closterium sp. NIES-67]|nr:hypothetical protein CLOP_g2352 [Closterium sp. NIES-67]